MTDEWWDTTVYKVEAPEFPLKKTGLLDGKGRTIYKKAVVGFTRQLSEYVVNADDEGKS